MATSTLINEGYAEEKGSCGIQFNFFDTDGVTPVTPLVPLTWSLTNTKGDWINGKEDVSITPGTSIIVVLNGDDLALPENGISERIVTIEGTYNSTTLGSGVNLKTKHTFSIKPLRAV